MDNTPLVEKQIQEGKLFISELDKADLQIKAAFWLYDDTNTWKLVIASSSEKLNVKENLLDAYGALIDILRSMSKLTILSGSDLELISLDHPLIKNIGSVVKTGPELVDIRVSKTLFNSVYIDAMYIYRMDV